MYIHLITRIEDNPLEGEVAWREERLKWKENCARRAGASEADIENEFGEEREYLERLRAWIGPPPTRDRPD